VVPDLKRKLPGRGCGSRRRRTALRSGAAQGFARGFKREVRAAPTLVAETERLLVAAALDALAIAPRPAGRLRLRQGRGALARDAGSPGLIHASDAAPTGSANWARCVRQNARDADESREIPVIAALTSAQLDLALGRSNVIHAALLAGPASKTFLARCQRLVRYRMADPDDKTGDAAKNSD
jgi:hypothetical protein